MASIGMFRTRPKQSERGVIIVRSSSSHQHSTGLVPATVPAVRQQEVSGGRRWMKESERMEGEPPAKKLMTVSVELSSYRDQHFKGSRGEQEKLLKLTTTLYVGNLAFFTTEEQIHELFSKCGDIKRIVMGLDKFKKTPCGFCFMEYYTRPDAENAMRYINGTRLDDRIIRTDWDAGFIEGRQYGRGKSGGQVRDEYRTDYDAGRGGYSKLVQQKLTNQQFFNP